MITINNFSMVGVLSNGERCKHFQFESQLSMFVFVHVKFSTYIQKLYHLGSGLAYFPFINLNLISWQVCLLELKIIKNWRKQLLWTDKFNVNFVVKTEDIIFLNILIRNQWMEITNPYMKNYPINEFEFP